MPFPRTSIALVSVAALSGVGVVAGPASPASAKTLKACYNKKSGDMTFLKKGKCKKGWKKLTWNSQGIPGATGPQGPQGSQGPAGPQLSVKDQNGVTLGSFAGFYSYGSNPTIMLFSNGGLYGYDTDGYLQEASTVIYTSVGCDGTPYYPTTAASAPFYLRTVGSYSRAVVRPTTPSYGPAQAFQLTNNTVTIAVNTATYYRNAAGACVSYNATFQGVLIAWAPVAAPVDGQGPLSVV